MLKRIGAVTLAFVLGLLIGSAPALRAEYNNITGTDAGNIITAQVVTAGGTYTSRPFTGLGRGVTQTVQVQGTGTGPNYKVEMLVTIDGTIYTKPEVGGDLGTFTDQNNHIIPVAVPLSTGHELKITELGGANTITITGRELAQ